jgi:GNAT superfamily N-acetyltransferase
MCNTANPKKKIYKQEENMMVEIFDIRTREDLFNEALEYFWNQWGIGSNYNFYKDCMYHSCLTESKLPRFYIALQDGKIVGVYALLANDLNSRQDLKPWFACLYVAPESRGQNLGIALQKHAIEQAERAGYQRIYLCTDLKGYYERNNWKYVCEGYLFNGDSTRIYEIEINT